MARKPKKDIKDPLNNVDRYDPKSKPAAKTAVSNKTNNIISNTPVSPLGPPIHIPSTEPDAASGILREAHNRISQLQTELAEEQERRRKIEKRSIELETAVSFSENLSDELKQERNNRLVLEREMAALEVEVKQVHQTLEKLEVERNQRIELEKRLATVEVRAERAQEMAAQLAEEQKVRVTLEREKATLDVQVQNMRKLDQLLSEERQARMNAQSRASSAEAQLARLEGERDQQYGTEKKRGLIKRLWG
jgi:chromosome segregation ATPase